MNSFKRDKDEFLRLLATECGYGDAASAGLVYFALIRMIAQTLRRQGFIYLPGLGEIKLKVRPGKPRYDLKLKTMVTPETDRRITFTFAKKLREYLRAIISLDEEKIYGQHR